jgi:hypothetical protein
MGNFFEPIWSHCVNVLPVWTPVDMGFCVGIEHIYIDIETFCCFRILYSLFLISSVRNIETDFVLNACFFCRPLM